jgi:hypothetical protein
VPTDRELVELCRKYEEGRYLSSEIAEEIKGYMTMNSKHLTDFQTSVLFSMLRRKFY